MYLDGGTRSLRPQAPGRRPKNLDSQDPTMANGSHTSTQRQQRPSVVRDRYARATRRIGRSVLSAAIVVGGTIGVVQSLDGFGTTSGTAAPHSAISHR